MTTPRKPEIQILAIWRIMLALVSIVPAVLVSILFRIGSLVWIISAVVWGTAFISMYLVYLPMLYKNVTFKLTRDKIILTTGVFSHRIIAVPLSEIRFTSVTTSVVARLFGLSDVTVTAAGGRVVLHGLKTSDAKALALALNP